MEPDQDIKIIRNRNLILQVFRTHFPPFFDHLHRSPQSNLLDCPHPTRQVDPLKLQPKHALCLLFLAVLLAYSNSFNNSFHFDDFHTITDNPAVRSLSNIPTFFSDATTFSVLPANRTWRPIVSTSLTFDYALARGYTPLWFHLSTFLVFLALIACIYYFSLEIFDRTRPSTANPWLALLAAAWFGLHPAMAETVNYIIQRGDIYCTLGCVAALLLYARRPSLRRYGLYLIPLIFALLSKPPAAVFPILLGLYVFFFEPNPRRLRNTLVSIIPATVVTAILLYAQSALTPKSFTPSILSAADYRLTQPFVWLRYIGELLLPTHLNADTDLSPISTLNAQTIAGLVFLLLFIAAIFLSTRRKTLRPLTFGLLWFVITQLPTSLYPLSEVENDHRMFFSFAMLIPALIWAFAQIARKSIAAPTRRKLIPATIALSLLTLTAYAVGTHRRNTVWATEESLWLDDVQKSPHNGRGLMNYGLTQMAIGKYDIALDYFNRALVYNPNYPTLEINLGIVHGAMRHPDEALQHFQRAIALAPTDDLPHAYLGRYLVEQGRPAEAIPELQTAISLNPARPMQHDLLAAAQAQQQAQASQPAMQSSQITNPAATAAIQQAAALAAFINRSLALNKSGKYQESITAAQAALKLNPNSAEAWNNIAANYEALHQWDPAITAARKAVALNPNFQLAKNNLAWSLQQKQLGTK